MRHSLSPAFRLAGPQSAVMKRSRNAIIRKTIFAAGIALAPQLASAQTVVSDPALLSIAKQQLTVQQQQLVVLNEIEALEQSKATGPVAAAALAYAQQQAQVEQAQQQAQTAEAAQK